MWKSTTISIIIAGNNENVYFSGQAVSGHVHVQTTETIKMRGIRLELTGKAKVRWSEDQDDSQAKVRWSEGPGDSRRTYLGREELLNLHIDVIGSRDKNSELRLLPGTYNFPFTFGIPPYLPSTYEHKLGRIRYKMKAVIDRPLKIDDTAKVDFKIIRPLDLNHEPPQLREPVVVQSQSPATGCCCVYGSPEIDIMLNKGLFIVGETILVQGEISNRTNSKIKYSTIAFVQNTEFCATRRKNGEICHNTYVTKIIAKVERPAIRRGSSDSWNDISFVIPLLPSSRLDGCRIINISYHIEVTAVFCDFCSNSSARCGLIIGNIPLSSDFPPSVITSQPWRSAGVGPGMAMPFTISGTTRGVYSPLHFGRGARRQDLLYGGRPV